MADDGKRSIERILDGEMRVHRMTGPILGALAVAVRMLAIVRVFRASL